MNTSVAAFRGNRRQRGAFGGPPVHANREGITNHRLLPVRGVVVNRAEGGPKEPPAGGALQIRTDHRLTVPAAGRSSDRTSSPASRFVGCRGQRSSAWALALQAMRKRLSCSGSVAESVIATQPWTRFAWQRGAGSDRNERSVHGGCVGPVLDVEVAHLGLVVEVMVGHLRVAGRRISSRGRLSSTGGRVDGGRGARGPGSHDGSIVPPTPLPACAAYAPYSGRSG